MTPVGRRVRSRRARTLRDFQVRQHPSFRGWYTITHRCFGRWTVEPTVYQDLVAALAAVDQMLRTRRMLSGFLEGSPFAAFNIDE